MKEEEIKAELDEILEKMVRFDKEMVKLKEEASNAIEKMKPLRIRIKTTVERFLELKELEGKKDERI